jgi:hypothetical protein
MSCFSFYLFSFFFYKIREQAAQWGRTGTNGRRKVLGKRGRRVNIVQKCAHM